MEFEENDKIKEKCLLRVLDELGESSKLLWIVFITSIIAPFLNGMHSMSYVFISEIPEHWCSIKELQKSNWTIEEIKNISTVDECHIYDYNYKNLANLKYEDAEEYVKDLKQNTSIVPCLSFVFDNSERSTIVNEWELVCDKYLYRGNTFSTYALGRLLGNGFLGIYADKYGRKKAIIIALLLQIIAVPSSGLVPWYWAFIFFKLITGMSTGSLYSSSYTILSEVAVDKKRKILGTIFDIQYPVGTWVVLSIAYFMLDWRQFQLALTIFTIPMIILVWFIPESPRWLISQKRYDEAQKIIEKYRKIIVTPALIAGSSNLPLPFSQAETKRKKQRKYLIERYFKSMKILLTNSNLRKKLFTMYYSFFVSISVSYCLVFSIDTFQANRYIYMASTASGEVLALMTTSVILMFLSAKKATIAIYFFVSICMLTITFIPKANMTIIIVMTVISKFCLTANYTTNMLFASELFPPGVRNTAFGTSFVMGQIGTMGAPFFVDLLSKVAWWAPTSICGLLTLLAGLLCCTISVKE
ncbi:GSCOCG00001720001-RA-CDS [Cotesia congregata]|nr:GSCOCG00001720001-RA-CDS [Cotesia congregata]